LSHKAIHEARAIRDAEKRDRPQNGISISSFGFQLGRSPCSIRRPAAARPFAG
jgi:hypothetical protein